MIVTCQKCSSRFALDETVLKKEGSKVQCSKCKDIFTVFPPSEKASAEKDEGDNLFKDLMPKDSEPAAISEDTQAFLKETPYDFETPDAGKEIPSDFSTLDLSEKPETDLTKGDFEFVLEEDSEIDGGISSAQKPGGSGRADPDISELEEIFRIETEAKPEKEPVEAPGILLEEEPKEPITEFDIETLKEPVLESEEKESPVETPTKEFETSEAVAKADVIDELDLSEFKEETPAETAVPAAKAFLEKAPADEFQIESEEPFELETREPIATESGAKADRFAGIAKDRFEEAPQFIDQDVEPLPEPEELPPETYSLTGKPKRIGSFLRGLLILILIAGAGYGAFILTNRMGISIPFLSNFSKTKAAAPGNLRIQILDVDGHFITSPEHGKRFVISGKIKNDYTQARRDIQITGNLLRKGQQIITSKTVYSGNLIPETDLVKMDMDAIDARLSGRPAGGVTQTSLNPRQTGSFMIVFGKLPKNLEEYSVTVNDSQAAK